MIYVKTGGVWTLARRVYIKSAGVWIEPSKIWIKDGGVFKMVHGSTVISSNQRNVNVATLFGSPSTKITAVVTVNAGIIIGSTSTSSPSLDTTGLPAGSILFLRILGSAFIVGKGGQGGPGGGGSGSDGLPGGNAINLTVQMLLDNAGTVGGGGGGGAGGATWPGHDPATGGGGGGAGDDVGAGGVGYIGGGPGSPGTLTAGGANGGGHCPATNGASLGATASNSGSCDAQPGATGGVGGKAINLNGNSVTFINTGTILGAVS